MHRDVLFLFELLHGREFPLAAFHAIEGQQGGHRGRSCRADQADRFANCCSCGQDVINDGDSPFKRRADQAATFAVILRLLAVVGKGHIPPVFGQHGGDRGGQGNAFVGWPEQQVEFHPAGIQQRDITLCQAAQRQARRDRAQIEEIGAAAPRFEREITEAQDPAAGCQVQKVIAIVRHKPVFFGSAGMIAADLASCPVMRIISVNTNGIRAAARKGFFDWLPRQDADVVCVQETKAQEHQLENDAQFYPQGYSCFYEDATSKKGYSGVALYSRREPDALIRGLGIPEFDAEGRYIEARFGNLSVVSLYLPSGSSSAERQLAKYRFLDGFLPILRDMRDSGRRYVLCGDWNIAHRECDLKNWKSNQKNSGFLPEERAWMDELFNELGWIDAYRQLYPEHTGEAYTWWSNRGQAWANNVGWRIDYQIVSPELSGRLKCGSVYKDQRFSDHAPLTLDYDLEF